MKVIHKSPQPEIRIYDYNAPFTPVLELSAKEGAYSQLLDYSFTENVHDLNGSFSFSIAGGDNDLFNKIKPLQIVKIFEGAEKPSFAGIIKSKHLHCSMTDSGVRRGISFQGKSITSLIADFQLIMDVKFLADLDIQMASTRNTDLKIKIDELQKKTGLLKIEEFLKTTWKVYLEYTGIAKNTASGKPSASNVLVYQIIKNFLGEHFFEIGKAQSIPIPIANSFFNQDINTVLQIWQTILTPPVYEIFSRVNEKGETKIVARETPFDADDWRGLKKIKIASEDLIDYSLRLSDEEVYTAFLGYIEGSELSADQYVILNQTEAKKRGKSILQMQDDKFALYGLKMCQVGFRGYEKENFSKDQTIAAMVKVGERLKAWFGRLDEMYTGSATIINHFNGNPPMTGTVIDFLGGQFYINGKEHRWSYGAAPVISLSIIRGGVYDNGRFEKTLPDMGKSRIELR
ncbi:hypothetical protein [Treponema pedis]|uniref:hypothetical protein n=1 Tax=Treponema pedis TaxID=409322 RepID=UPI0004269351|nr:hypothetical protein [Treponema pedis]